MARGHDEPAEFARIVNIRLYPESFDQAFEHFRNVSAPLIARQQGSLGMLGAANHVTGTTWAISLWHTHADLLNSNSPPDVVEAMMAYTQWMIGSFAVQTYNILHGKIALPDPNATANEWARITTVIPDPNSVDDAIASLRRRLVRLETRYAGSRGTLLLSQTLGNRLIAIELWSSADTLAASDPEAMSQDQRIRIDVPLHSLPVRDEVEVFGRF